MLPTLRSRRLRLATATTTAAVVAATIAGTAIGAVPHTARHRPTTTVTTWAASDDKAGGSLTDVTLRDLVHTTVAGEDARFRLSNYFGTSPITFSSVYVGTPVAPDSAALVPGTNRRLRFGGQTSVTIPAGGVVLSDPLPGHLGAGAYLAVSLALQGTAGVITAHNRTMQYTFKSGTGDWAADASAEHFGTQDANWFFLDAVTVEATSGQGTMAALGDSITDGVGSTMNANHRWTDYLADRVADLPAPQRFGIANEGISGNQVVSGGGSAGVPGATRLVRDVLTKPGIASVFLFEGINDIGAGRSAAALIAADRQIATQAHAMGLCVFAATLTPATIGSGAAGEEVRRTVNQYLRTTDDVDAVVDFDRVAADPADPSRLRAAYDSGDHIHLSDAGYAALAGAVDPRRLTC